MVIFEIRETRHLGQLLKEGKKIAVFAVGATPDRAETTAELLKLTP